MLNTEAISVSQLNSYIKAIIDVDKNLKNIFVIGEISNLKQSGHIYFSLKDSSSLIRAVMFFNNASNLNISLYNGMKVIVKGNVRCYEASGQYQIYVNEIYPYGVGMAYLEFEKLKSKLFEEGLFDESHKKQLPVYPKKIGVITSKTGSVRHDIENVTNRRYPICEIVLYPVKVQGDNASKEIVNGIKKLNSMPDIDIIIVGRGGGSAEDLNPFNSEDVARAVYESNIPIISAVGHETDFTICDLVADKRASTPSVAGEMAVPDIKDLKYIVNEYEKSIKNIFENKIKFCYQELESLKSQIKKAFPVSKIDDMILNLQNNKKLLKKHFDFCLLQKNSKFDSLNQKLKFYSYKENLKHGYSLVLSKTGNIIKNISELSNIDEIEIIMQDGNMKFKISKI